MSVFSQSFQVQNYSLAHFFSRPAIGYVIPNFQRGYEWRQLNIDNLVDDICDGLIGFIDKKEEIHFFGTLILLPVQSIDFQRFLDSPDARPSNIEFVIDGQQRISTFALLGTILYENLYNAKRMLLREEELSFLRSSLDLTLNLLRNAFSFDQPNAKPRMKPKIIREHNDHWTTGGPDSRYESHISSFLAQFIRLVDKADQDAGQGSLPMLDSTQFGSLKPIIDLVRKEVKTLRKEVREQNQEGVRAIYQIPESAVIVSQLKSNPDFYFADSVLSYLSDTSKSISRRRLVDATVKLYAFCHFLLHRCGFTVISPTSDDWAFDLFQTLNTTGVPLTVLETFKPLLVSRVEKFVDVFEDSPACAHFAVVEKYIDEEENKEKRINDDER